MRTRLEMSTIFALVVALGAVAAGLAHIHEDALSHDPLDEAETTAPVQDTAEWDDYTPSAHCGLGSGLHDITSH